MSLPPLREELLLHLGPATLDGAPTWSLHDPVRNIFFRIDWLTYEILARWALNSPDAICNAIENETPIQPEAEDISAVIHFLAENELLQRFDQNGSRWYWHNQRVRTMSWGKWLLHHYLFVRIPLWRPDAWLRRFSPWVSFFTPRLFLF